MKNNGDDQVEKRTFLINFKDKFLLFLRGNN